MIGVRITAVAVAMIVLVGGCSTAPSAQPGLTAESASETNAAYLEESLAGLPSGTQLWTSNPRLPSVPCVGSPPYDDAPRRTGAIFVARGLSGSTSAALDGLVRYWTEDRGYTPVTDTRTEAPGSTSDAFASVDTPDDYRLAAATRSDVGLTVNISSPCYEAAGEGGGPLYPETIGPA